MAVTPESAIDQALPIPSHKSGERGRWNVAFAFGSACVLYFAVINSSLLDANHIVILNDAMWTLFGLGAAGVCLFSAHNLRGAERRAWRWVAAGCLSWLAGQSVWDYYELGIGRLPQFPHWMQTLFMGYPLLLVVGMLHFPKPASDVARVAGITMRHAGNLGLIVCAVAGVLALAITEPAALSNRSLGSIGVSLGHCLAYSIASMTALYLLWSYRWQAAYWPLVLITLGSGLHATAFVADMHGRLAGTYQPSDWVNAAWLVALGSVACAAYEYAWQANHTTPKGPDTLMRREQLLEAVMPALLVLVVAASAVLSADWISPRVVYLCAAVGAAFAILLGIREAWIQREEQRLLTALSASNESLLATNRDLSDSEQRFRQLNRELEHHVAERTRNLQRAYEELERFSYAVAHDLKAPLRAVDGFGALLATEYSDRLDDRGRAYVARMRRGALTMAHLVDDLLAYARVDRREAQNVETTIGDIVTECVEEQREEIDRGGIALSIDAQNSKLVLDREGLGIALRNVIQNAIKFGRGAPAPRIEVTGRHENRRLTVTVRDNGIGFDMEYHDRIFAMFQRLHRADDYPGTGIGLAIARKAVERAGGRIWAQSKRGEGAVFFIELPTH